MSLYCIRLNVPQPSINILEDCQLAKNRNEHTLNYIELYVRRKILSSITVSRVILAGVIVAIVVVDVYYAKYKHRQIIFGYERQFSRILPKCPNFANLWHSRFKALNITQHKGTANFTRNTLKSSVCAFKVHVFQVLKFQPRERFESNYEYAYVSF